MIILFKQYSLMKIHNFSAGPSMLPQEILERAAQAVLNFDDTGLSLIEISHRTPAFVEIMNEARQLALELLGLQNKGYTALFLQGGASLEFARLAYNFIKNEGKAGYVNTGTWANNAQNEATLIGQVLEIASTKDEKYTSIPKEILIPEGLNYVHITSNNTIYGTQFKVFPKVEAPLICDMSSDIFSRNLDFSQFDMIYACAQKNVGTSGINLIVIKDELAKKGNKNLPNIMSYQSHIEKESMYNTPSVFSVYVSYLTLKWMKDLGGITALERRNKAKSTLIYSEIDRNSLFYGSTVTPDRSDMNAVFNLKNEQLTVAFDTFCATHNISGLKGHRTVGGYRASIYNALPIESVMHLVDVMQQFEKLYQ